MWHVNRQYREHVKDLSCISNDPSRIVIVDNNPFSFLLQPLNGIPCVPFSAGQPHDTQVERFITQTYSINFQKLFFLLLITSLSVSYGLSAS